MEYTTQQFQAGHVLRASQLNAMDAAIKTSMKSSLPVDVELSKVKLDKHINIVINITGLDPDQEYIMQMFRWSESQHKWDAMWDEATQQSNFGWAELCGKIRGKDRETKQYSFFTNEIPEWMPNGGRLQGRWDITPTDGEQLITVDPGIWMIDALKPWCGCEFAASDLPDVDTANAGLCGIHNKRHTSLRFKVGILQKAPIGDYQLVGLSKATLSVFYSDLLSVKDDRCVGIHTTIAR